MRPIALVVTALCPLTVAACEVGSDPGGEPAGLEGITAQHNRVRAEVDVPPLAWDPGLAAIAATWAARCIDNNGDGFIDHDSDSAGVYPEIVGENLYGSTGAVTGVDAALGWEREEVDFTYPDQCAAGQVCGHYTQMVWSTTTKLGCAIGTCPDHRFGNVVVCNYAPAGNWVGLPPY